MKYILKMLPIVIFFVATVLTVYGKSAIVVAHYGSSDAQTRMNTIGRITTDIMEAYPGMDVRTAYISPVVRRSMIAAGQPSKSVLGVLDELYTQSYDTVYVQSTTIIEGGEMGEVRRCAELMSPYFKCMKVGKPLCYSVNDCARVASILAREPAKEGEMLIWVGHGNDLPSTATYSQLDNMLRNLTSNGMMVSTIEGYPTAQSTLAAIQQGDKPYVVKLMPLLLVCGRHTKEDIAGDFAAAIREQGYNVEVVMHGLAENQQIRSIYVERIRELINPDK